MILRALVRTITEIADSKKAAYSFIAVAIAIVLHLEFGIAPEEALLLVSPLGVATVAQAHVDARTAASAAKTASVTVTASAASPPPTDGAADSPPQG